MFINCLVLSRYFFPFKLLIARCMNLICRMPISNEDLTEKNYPYVYFRLILFRLQKLEAQLILLNSLLIYSQLHEKDLMEQLNKLKHDSFYWCQGITFSEKKDKISFRCIPVSYTHLTLPTILLV